MEVSEIERYLAVSRTHTVCVDAVECDAAPGYLRKTTVFRRLSVVIEFELCQSYVDDDGEGGELRYSGEYGDLSTLILDLERFLGRGVSEWVNLSARPYNPKQLLNTHPERSHDYFVSLVRSDSVVLPAAGNFQVSDPYWRHIKKFGEFRADKVFEEQDEHLRARIAREDKGE